MLLCVLPAAALDVYLSLTGHYFSGVIPGYFCALSVPKKWPLGIVRAEVLQTRFPSRSSAGSFKALKVLRVITAVLYLKHSCWGSVIRSLMLSPLTKG